MFLRIFETHKEFAVLANDIKDFCNKYANPEKYHKQSEDAQQSFRNSLENQITRYWFAVLLADMNITGKKIAYYPPPECKICSKDLSKYKDGWEKAYMPYYCTRECYFSVKTPFKY